MLLKKLLALMLAVLLLVIADFAAVQGFFYLCVFPIPAGDEITHLGADYAGAVVLSSCDVEHDYFRYLLVEMPSGETRVLALQESHNFKGRYRFVPEDVLYVPEERPFVEKIRTATGSASIWVMEDNSIRALDVSYNYMGTVENFTQLIFYALMAAEFALWLVIVRLRNGPVPTLPTGYSAAPQEDGTPLPALNRHSLRSGPGHPAQRISAKRLLKPVLRLLLLTAAGFAAIYFIFQTLVFTATFDGSPASLGPEYEEAVILTPHSDSLNPVDFAKFYPEQSRCTYLICTTSDETRLLILKRSVLHPGRYQADSVLIPEERPYALLYTGLGLKTTVEIGSDSQISLWPGPGGAFSNGSFDLENLEFLLYFGWEIFALGFSVYLSRKIEPPKDGERKG